MTVLVRAACPKCGARNLLVTMNVLGMLPEKGYAGEPYGNPTLGFFDLRSGVECNSHGCGWVGTVKEARKAENSNPKV